MPDDPPVVLVEWVDSCTLEGGGWMEVDEIPGSLTIDAMLHESVGYLVCDNDAGVALAGSRNIPADEQDRNSKLCGVATIPRGAIVRGPVELAPRRPRPPAKA
jgi:hypothetical protein